jgi:hypothetical protein
MQVDGQVQPGMYADDMGNLHRQRVVWFRSRLCNYMDCMEPSEDLTLRM